MCAAAAARRLSTTPPPGGLPGDLRGDEMKKVLLILFPVALFLLGGCMGPGARANTLGCAFDASGNSISPNFLAGTINECGDRYAKYVYHLCINLPHTPSSLCPTTVTGVAWKQTTGNAWYYSYSATNNDNYLVSSDVQLGWCIDGSGNRVMTDHSCATGDNTPSVWPSFKEVIESCLVDHIFCSHH